MADAPKWVKQWLCDEPPGLTSYPGRVHERASPPGAQQSLPLSPQISERHCPREGAMRFDLRYEKRKGNNRAVVGKGGFTLRS